MKDILRAALSVPALKVADVAYNKAAILQRMKEAEFRITNIRNLAQQDGKNIRQERQYRVRVGIRSALVTAQGIIQKNTKCITMRCNRFIRCIMNRRILGTGLIRTQNT